MKSRILAIFTRTPLHVGAGSSVGAIDQPVIRERHTGFPIIPGSSIKGVLADLWNSELISSNGKILRATEKREQRNGLERFVADQTTEAAWLFGSDNDKIASAGALSVGEARLLAFPIRSARGSFAWITSPFLLARAARDGVPAVQSLDRDQAAPLTEKSSDSSALFTANAPIALPAANGAQSARAILEDYTFTHAGELPQWLPTALKNLLPNESVLTDLERRLVIVTDGIMSHFAQTACEVAQHVRINDARGTAEDSGLFNQENVPSESLLYSTVSATNGRSQEHRKNTAESALEVLAERIQKNKNTLQIGADATTGLGYCTVFLVDSINESAAS